MNPPSSDPFSSPHDARLGAPANPNDSHSRSSSVNSHSPSVQSAANSTRYMLSGMNNNSTGLDPPNLPYGSRASSFRSSSPGNSTPLIDAKGLPTSLSVNYLPSKFSDLGGGMKRRKGGKVGGIALPKRGGGRDAFKANESRMPGDGDDDYDGVDVGKGRKGGRNRWNRFKWILFISNLVVSVLSISSCFFLPSLHLSDSALDPSRSCLYALLRRTLVAPRDGGFLSCIAVTFPPL